MSLPTHNEIRQTINQSGCDLFAFFETGGSTDQTPNDQCYIHSISHQDTELLAVNIRRDDTPAVAGLMTHLMTRWKSNPVQPGENCFAKGSNLMLKATRPDEAHLDHIMDKLVHSAVDYRGNKDFSILMLFPIRHLTNEEIERTTAAS